MTTIYHFKKERGNMENKFKGYYWDKESKKPASAEEINAKIEEAKDPSITFKLSELENLNVDTLKKKLEEGKEEITFYGKFEPEQ